MMKEMNKCIWSVLRGQCSFLPSQNASIKRQTWHCYSNGRTCMTLKCREKWAACPRRRHNQSAISAWWREPSPVTERVEGVIFLENRREIWSKYTWASYLYESDIEACLIKRDWRTTSRIIGPRLVLLMVKIPGTFVRAVPCRKSLWIQQHIMSRGFDKLLGVKDDPAHQSEGSQATTVRSSQIASVWLQ